MCDSLTALFLLANQSQTEYDNCNYPSRGKDDTDQASSDFRDQHPKSPLTGAGFKITPIGVKLKSAHGIGPIQKGRMFHGRIAGYLVDINPPACTVGHNRLLVNGVPFATRVGLELLKHWMAENGCTSNGLAAVEQGVTHLISVTPTFLFKFTTEDQARIVLAQFRTQTETLCNPRKSKKGEKVPAFSYPPEPQKGQGTYTYTSYVKRRQYLLDCYVKVPGAVGAFLKPVHEGGAEVEISRDALRTIRIGVKLNGKWLEERGLHEAKAWATDNVKNAYETAFAIIREELRLDDALRPKQLRSPTVSGLNLSKKEQTLLLHHLKGKIAREHDMFKMMSKLQASKAYSASKKRIFDRIKLDLDIDYSSQLKAIFPELADILMYPGEYHPSDKVAPFIYSRLSVPVALKRLAGLTDELLNVDAVRQESANSKAPATKVYRSPTAKSGGSRPLLSRRGISNVPLPPQLLKDI